MRKFARPDVIAVAAILAVNAFAGWHFATGGGLFFDDYVIRAVALYEGGADEQGMGGWFASLADFFGSRPVTVVLSFLQVLILNGSAGAYAVAPVLVYAVLCVAVYFGLREVGLSPHAAGCAAVLAAALPYAAVVRFWATTTVITFATITVITGLILGLRALRTSSSRWQAVVSVLCFVVAAAAYESAAGLVLVAPLYYAAGLRKFPRAAAVKTVVDFAAVGVVLLALRAVAAGSNVTPMSAWVNHAETIVSDTWSLFTAGAVPEGGWGTLAKVVGVLALGAGVARVFWVAWSGSGRPEFRSSATQVALWAAVGVAGGVAVVASYLAFIPADGWYRPLQAGQGERVNGVATPGWALTYLGLAMTIASVAALGVGTRHALVRTGVATILVLLMAGSFVGQTRDRGSEHVEAWKNADSLMSAFRASFPDGLPRDANVLSFGAPGFAGAEVSALGSAWDFPAGLQLTFDDGSLRGFPVLEGQQLACTSTGVEVRYPGVLPDGPVAYSAPYDHLMFVDAFQRRSATVRNRSDCARVQPQFPPGPTFAPVPA